MSHSVVMELSEEVITVVIVSPVSLVQVSQKEIIIVSHLQRLTKLEIPLSQAPIIISEILPIQSSLLPLLITATSKALKLSLELLQMLEQEFPQFI